MRTITLTLDEDELGKLSDAIEALSEDTFVRTKAILCDDAFWGSLRTKIDDAWRNAK